MVNSTSFLVLLQQLLACALGNSREQKYLLAHDIVQNRFDRRNSLAYPIFPQNSHLSNSLSISSNASKKKKTKKKLPKL